MKDQIHTWKDTLLTILGIVVVFVIGAYFGYRVQEVQNFTQVTNLQAQVITAESSSGNQPDTSIISLEVPEVHWLAPGGESACPDTHPIKGKFSSTGNVAYSPNNKTYKRVIAHMCFVSVEYATTTAGFFEKQD